MILADFKILTFADALSFQRDAHVKINPLALNQASAQTTAALPAVEEGLAAARKAATQTP